jgi:hypothetical protein
LVHPKQQEIDLFWAWHHFGKGRGVSWYPYREELCWKKKNDFFKIPYSLIISIVGHPLSGKK